MSEQNNGQQPPEKKEKKSLSLNVVSNKEHKGFGAGTIDLSDVACVMIDNGEAYIDVGAMHAKSKIERGIKFGTNKEDVPNGRPCWIVWVAVERGEEGAHYAGATACPMLIDSEARRGWKILAQHVNNLDYAIKRRFMLDELGAEEKRALKGLLVAHNPEWWDRSPDKLKDALNV
ncbi:YwhD family protein [Paenibacillus sp. MWE-103]|uniref:YwhD family protein n=1 Tax=Paenibacillus artemisiicola TaxID=1172618 RepID=A0ABS3WKD9_9BACL|nr:YwhD family protein [Paenibacillus sp. UNC496MF]MBO7748600.1 YwhD family protein [Paenibacillus artemisiicola]SFJ72422.1 YwhD family protein [Paenibacillus sp. UNC496MF]